MVRHRATTRGDQAGRCSLLLRGGDAARFVAESLRELVLGHHPSNLTFVRVSDRRDIHIHISYIYKYIAFQPEKMFEREKYIVIINTQDGRLSRRRVDRASENGSRERPRGAPACRQHSRYTHKYNHAQQQAHSLQIQTHPRTRAPVLGIKIRIGMHDKFTVKYVQTPLLSTRWVDKTRRRVYCVYI